MNTVTEILGKEKQIKASNWLLYEHVNLNQSTVSRFITSPNTSFAVGSNQVHFQLTPIQKKKKKIEGPTNNEGAYNITHPHLFCLGSPRNFFSVPYRNIIEGERSSPLVLWVIVYNGLVKFDYQTS